MTFKEMCMKYCNVLVVDSDPMTLAIVSKMLRLYGYTVSTTRTATDALLSLAKKSRSGYQVILTDVHFPDMEKYEFIERMKLFSNSPFVVTSAEVSDQAKYDGLVKGGARLYLDKPVSMDDLKSLWQMAYRKPYRYHPVERIEFEEVRTFNGRSPPKAMALNEIANSWVSMKKPMNSQKAKREHRRGAGSDNYEQENENDCATSSKRPKLVWTDELHNMFLQAIDTIGIEVARPKAILQLMNVPGLTRGNISSHLQKHRLRLKSEQEAIQNKNTMTMARPIAESGFGNIPLFNGNIMDFSNVGNFDFGSSSGNPYSLSNFIRQSEKEQQPELQLPPLEEGTGDHDIYPGLEFDATDDLFKDRKRFYSGGVP